MEYLGKISGEISNEDLLDSIFKFLYRKVKNINFDLTLGVPLAEIIPTELAVVIHERIINLKLNVEKYSNFSIIYNQLGICTKFI